MLSHRVIPSLLLSDGGLVKTTGFAKPRYVGDPINAVRIFNEKEVDELIVLDIEASAAKRAPDFATAEQLADECFMPLCWGGGIRSFDDARTLFSLGIEKVAVQSAALEDMAVLTRIAERFGEQAVVFSLDLELDWRRRRRVRSAAGRRERGEWQAVLAAAVAAGAGEVLLTSVERDGTRRGMDLALIREASAMIDVPLIAAGGAGSLADMRAATDAGASAVAAGAYFVFQGPHRAVLITYPRPDELRALWSDAA